MRLTAHEDGYIYGVFCAERHDDDQPGDLSAATATAAIARTKDLVNWERLPDLKTKSQQRNVVLHPEFVDGKYAFYTRPQDGALLTKILANDNRIRSPPESAETGFCMSCAVNRSLARTVLTTVWDWMLVSNAFSSTDFPILRVDKSC